MATVILKTNPPRLGLALLRSNRNYPRQFRLIARTMSTERDQVIERARKLHTLNDPMQVKEYYKEWAKDYDKDKAMMGVKNDEFIQVFLTLDVPKDARILDIGCGTGDNGLLLRDAGYTNVDGLDFSQEMLDVAGGKGCYKKLINAMVAKEVVLPIEPKTYDLVVSSGSFCPGHMKWDSFGQIARVVKTGGIVYWNTPEHGHDHGHNHGHDHGHNHGHDHGHSHGQDHHHGHSHGETCEKGHEHHHANQTVDESQNHGHSGHHGDNKHFVDGFVQQKLWEYLPGYPMRKMVHIGDNTAKVTFYAMKVL